MRRTTATVATAGYPTHAALRGMRNLDVEDQQRNRDRENPVAERLDPSRLFRRGGHEWVPSFWTRRDRSICSSHCPPLAAAVALARGGILGTNTRFGARRGNHRRLPRHRSDSSAGALHLRA